MKTEYESSVVLYYTLYYLFLVEIKDRYLYVAQHLVVVIVAYNFLQG